MLDNSIFSSRTTIDFEKKIIIKRFENPYKMKEFIKILEYLNFIGFPVNEIIEINFAEKFVKLRYIEGYVFSDIYTKIESSYRQKILENLAEFIYKLHNSIKAKISVPFSLYIKKKYKKYLEYMKNKNKIVYRFSKQLINTINSQITDLSLIHGDLNLKNIIIDENYNIVGIIDWECSCYFDPLYDLAIFEGFNAYISERERMYFIKKYLTLANISYTYYHQLKTLYQYLRLIDHLGEKIDEKIIESVISMIEINKNIDIIKLIKS